MVLSRIYYILFVPNRQIVGLRLQESGPGKIGIDIWGESRIKTRSRVRLPSSRFLICVCFGMMESDFSVASATIFGRLFFLSGCFHFCVVESGVQGVPGLQRDYRNRERFPFSIACQTDAPTESRLDGGGVTLMATGYRFHQSTAVEPA